jgi:hypothetical protein
MEKIDDTLKLSDLKPSDLILFESWFQALPLSLKKLPISEAKKLLKKKPYITKKFAKGFKKKLDGDLWWIAQDADLLIKKIDELPTLVHKTPPAKRSFRTWQRKIRDHGSISLEKKLLHYQKVTSALLDSPKITTEEKNTIEATLIFVNKGTGAIVKHLSQNFKVGGIWRVPNGKRMLFGSDFNVKPYEDEDKKNKTDWINRVPDTRPYSSEDIGAQNAYNNFDLKDEVDKHPSLNRLERQILLLKCREDVPLEDIAHEFHKSLKSVTLTFNSARKKMDAWLEAISMKEILRNEHLRRDHFLFDPPPSKIVTLPLLWDDELAKTASPIREWFSQGQDFLESLIPSDEEKPFCW